MRADRTILAPLGISVAIRAGTRFGNIARRIIPTGAKKITHDGLHAPQPDFLEEPTFLCVNHKFSRHLILFRHILLAFHEYRISPSMPKVAAVGALRRQNQRSAVSYSKRLTDVLLASALLIATLPLMFFVALAIKCDSAGPLFYGQERVGLRGRRFAVLKFRSMREDAEADGGPVWAAAQDHRVTRVGRFIRWARIDELPQLWNVLRGEMSIVGPRPERPYFVEQFNKLIPFYDDRHAMLPGITGWAQVNYPYGASLEDAREKLRYDLHYISNHSFVLDLKILLATVRVVLSGKGAR
jgi:exopolysaccharide biosynthesis polyprenyl glycosylphosphotransferase